MFQIEFEEGNENQLATEMPADIISNTTRLIYLDHKDAMVDVKGKVPVQGYYTFVVHYYQPDFPGQYFMCYHIFPILGSGIFHFLCMFVIHLYPNMLLNF